MTRLSEYTISVKPFTDWKEITYRVRWDDCPEPWGVLYLGGPFSFYLPVRIEERWTGLPATLPPDGASIDRVVTIVFDENAPQRERVYFLSYEQAVAWVQKQVK